MFERNDRALLTARIIVMVIIGIFAVGSLAIGIALAVILDGVWFLITFALWLGCWLCWVWARLYMSYLCDVKLIRNKLYGESNKGLEDFLKTYREIVAEYDEKEKKAVETEAELAHLYQLMEQGIITEDEYKKREKDITERE